MAASAGARTTGRQHVTVCICTYKRPQLLLRLLTALGAQETGGLFTYSAVVADNDHWESARTMVCDLAATASMPLSYCVEPRQNIALARNKAVENSTGDFIAFIDDDEVPPRDWLVRLVKAIKKYQADGVLGSSCPAFSDRRRTGFAAEDSSTALRLRPAPGCDGSRPVRETFCCAGASSTTGGTDSGPSAAAGARTLISSGE